MACAIMIACAMQAEELVMEPFSGVKVVVPARVRILRGDAYSVAVNSSNEIVANLLSYKVQNGVLTITSPEDVQQSMDSSQMLITITTPEDAQVTTSRDMEVVPARARAEVKAERLWVDGE